VRVFSLQRLNSGRFERPFLSDFFWRATLDRVFAFSNLDRSCPLLFLIPLSKMLFLFERSQERFPRSAIMDLRPQDWRVFSSDGFPPPF